MQPPGSKIFKLRPLDKPWTDPKTQIRYTEECLEFQNPKCQDCHHGNIEVAYGVKDGIFDVYRFPCQCSNINGWKWERLDRPERYSGRPVSYQCKWADMPGDVFIHPRHSGKLMKRVHEIIHGMTEEMRRIAEEQAEAPF